MILERWSFLENIFGFRMEDKICVIFVVGVEVPIGTIFFTFSTKATAANGITPFVLLLTTIIGGFHAFFNDLVIQYLTR